MILRNGKEITPGKKPYIIAELNSSHNGSLDIAKEMMNSALECGCDCVKLQSWTSDTLYCDEYYEKNPLSIRFVKKFSFSENELFELFEYGKQIGIDVSSTPYSEAEVDFLADKTDAPFIKIASMEINNIPYLKYIAMKGLPIILSTGMADYDEVKVAVEAIKSAGCKNMCILHCVSVYPAPAEIINLNNMVQLKNLFPEYEVGYSDHTIGSTVACGAVALGAAVIEKHFTLDKTRIGMDNNMATEPKEMKELVERCHEMYEALGGAERIISEVELQQRAKMRRSIVAARDIKAGETISEDLIQFMRPGDGIAPNEIEQVVGCKVFSDVNKGHLLRWEHIGKQ